MEPINIVGTSHLPEIEFKTDGTLRMEGRSIPEDVLKLFNPLLDFVLKLEGVDVTFKVKLEYFNTATSKKLMELFKTIDGNNKIGKIIIDWHFEEGDEDSVEMAEIYADSLLHSEFRYHEYAEIQMI
jgi:hypothetical protein